VNARDVDGQTPLHWAVDKEDTAVVLVLLSNRADTSAQDALKHSALHRAAALGLGRIARLLLDRGADVNAKNSNGWTPVSADARASDKLARRRFTWPATTLTKMCWLHCCRLRTAPMSNWPTKMGASGGAALLLVG
jgi:hypothetical protein